MTVAALDGDAEAGVLGNEAAFELVHDGLDMGGADSEEGGGDGVGELVPATGGDEGLGGGHGLDDEAAGFAGFEDVVGAALGLACRALKILSGNNHRGGVGVGGEVGSGGCSYFHGRIARTMLWLSGGARRFVQRGFMLVCLLR